MDNNLVLSVLIPVYNTAAYLDKCLISIQEQSYKNIEVIVVDDGSTDGSGEILDSWAKKDKRIKVIHQKNEGVIVARESAIEAAAGDYVTFVDSDDWVEKDYFALLMEAIQRNNADISVGGMSVDYSKHSEYPFALKKEIILKEDNPLVELFAFRYYRWELWAKVFRRELVQGIKVSRHIVCGDDLARSWQIFAKSSKVVCVPTTGYHYVQRENSIRKIHALPYEKTVSYVLADMKNDIRRQSSNVYDSYLRRVNEFMVTDLLLMLSSESKDMQAMEVMHRAIKSNFYKYGHTSVSWRRKIIIKWLCLPFSFVYRSRWLIRKYLQIRNGI